MKHRVCDKCGEIVAKTGFVSSASSVSGGAGKFGICNNKDCRKYFSKAEYEKLKEREF